MGAKEMGTLIDRWLNDQQFRSAVRKEPEKAIRATGIALSADEWDIVRGIDWSLTDTQLRERITKAFG